MKNPKDPLLENYNSNKQDKWDRVVNSESEVERPMHGVENFTFVVNFVYLVEEHLAVTQIPVPENHHADRCILHELERFEVKPSI